MDNTTKELIEKFKSFETNFSYDSGYSFEMLQTDDAKQCAIICVEHEIDLINRLLKTGLHNDFDLMRERGELYELKSSIDKH